MAFSCNFEESSFYLLAIYVVRSKRTCLIREHLPGKDKQEERHFQFQGSNFYQQADRGREDPKSWQETNLEGTQIIILWDPEQGIQFNGFQLKKERVRL